MRGAQRVCVQIAATLVGAARAGAIERSLARSALSHATPLVVHVHHWEYQGELLRTGKMGMLKERVPQTPLPPALLQVAAAS